MRFLSQILAVALATMISLAMVSGAIADSSPYSVSSALTDFLHHHRLPAVGAQVAPADDGYDNVMLYGFVATPRGKSDAEKRTREFLNDVPIRITNRIRIDPNLLARGVNQPDRASFAPSTNSPSGIAGAAAAAQEAALPPANLGTLQQYQAQSQS